MTRVTVVHLVHSNDYGGVETAAAHLQRQLRSDPVIDYRLYTLRATSQAHDRAFDPDFSGNGLNLPGSYVRVLKHLREAKPDVLVTSLWRSVLVGFAATIPRDIAWAVYLHNTRWTHQVDAFAHRMSWNRADAILADSEASRTLVPSDAQSKVAIVRPAASPLPIDSSSLLSYPVRLVFWGRLAGQKRLDRAIDLLAILQRERPGAFTMELIGPDAGQWSPLKDRATRLGVANALIRTGPLDRVSLAKRVARSHIFVQLSDFEGLGMSVVEALGAGLIPVVTPVGDVGKTTEDGRNAIHLGTLTSDGVCVSEDDLEGAAKRILSLVDDPVAFAAMRSRTHTAVPSSFVSDFRDKVLALAVAKE